MSERNVRIFMRVLLGLTLDKVAEQEGISRERVRQIVLKVKRKLCYMPNDFYLDEIRANKDMYWAAAARWWGQRYHA